MSDGLSAMRLMVGWIVGEYLAWRVIHRQLRELSEELQARSVAGGLAHYFPWCESCARR